MEQSQHVNIAARIQQLIVSRHINKQETKMQKAKLKLTNDLYNKYNDESLFVLSPKETQIRKLEQQNKYLERYLNSLLRERKPKRLNRFRIIGKSIIAAYVQKYKENNAPFTHTHTHTSIYLSIYVNLPVHALTCKSTHLFPLICSRRVAAKRWQKKQVIEAVWQQELKINDSNFHSILIASKKANHEALYNAAISYVARNLKRLKSTKAFQNLQKEPEILISILEQAKSPRSNYVYGI